MTVKTSSDQQLRRGRLRLAGYLLVLCYGIPMVVAVLTIISCMALIKGGVDFLVLIWTTRNASELISPWPALFIGIPVGIAVGYWFWRWIIAKTGFLNEAEVRSMCEDRESHGRGGKPPT